MPRPPSKILNAAEAKAADLDKQIKAQEKVVDKARKEYDKEFAKLGKLKDRQAKVSAKAQPVEEFDRAAAI